MIKKIFIITLVMLSSSGLNAQNFSREAGLRGGATSGFTYRHYLNDHLSYEGILSFRGSGMQFTLLRQIHEGSFVELGQYFHFLYGFGAHTGFFFDDTYKVFGSREYFFPGRKFSPLLGLDGYAGIEYRLESYPVVIGIDYKPYFEFSLYQFFRLNLWDLAFTIKYRF